MTDRFPYQVFTWHSDRSKFIRVETVPAARAREAADVFRDAHPEHNGSELYLIGQGISEVSMRRLREEDEASIMIWRVDPHTTTATPVAPQRARGIF